VDTPGVLSGEKQRTQRSYDFTGVTSWFAAKCDLILLLFDPHKLDISDEFKRVIASLRGHDDKIRIVLNKADQVDAQQVNIPVYHRSPSLSSLSMSAYSIFLVRSFYILEICNKSNSFYCFP
jgi:predicted GTPase